MQVNISTGLLVLGGVLLLIGFLGGNFKLFGAEIAATISNRWLRFLAIIFGTVLIITALSKDVQPVIPIKTTWTCYHQGNSVGEVEIWWGHAEKDAEWACNEWRSQCHDGGCTATKISG